MTLCGDIIINTARGWIAHETMGKSGSRMHLFMYEDLLFLVGWYENALRGETW